jgi:predicted Ser/Thr protein kinase
MLEAGRRLGPYQVVAPIGAGGMGEVYKARDSRLERTVAIKILPEPFADSLERKQRFEREAKAISQLNHAHICTLHDIGHQDGIDFLVMEYLEGETLADRLKRGPLPLPEAVTAAIQIAAALDEAHRHGIVHRDLKPGNVVLTSSGVKLLDFGLAKLAETNAPEDSSHLPTEAKPLTSEGAILGTFQYMAPEQIEGKEADARTDLFALGVVLYEMLTGKKAFEGKTQASLIAAILEREPASVSTLQPLSPRSLDRIVSRCLAKDPAHRWESARDVREVLSWIEDGDEASTRTVESGRNGISWAVAGLAVAAGLAAYFHFSNVRPEESLVAHFTVALPEENAVIPTANQRDLAVSPDGEYVVYSGGGPRSLFVRPLGQMEVTTLVGPGGGPRDPFFSPDSEWVGYAINGALKKVSIRGGPATTLCDFDGGPRGASWGPNDAIVFATGNPATGLLRIPAAGGQPEVLTRPDTAAGERDHWWPEFLPNGQTVLFDIVSSGANASASQIAALSLEAGERKILIPGDRTRTTYRRATSSMWLKEP